MEYSERRVRTVRYDSVLTTSLSFTSTSETTGRFTGDFFDSTVSIASLVVLEGDFRAGNLEEVAGLRLGDLRAGDLREGDRAGGELFRVLAGDRGGETPFRLRGGLESTILGLTRPLLVDIIVEYI